MYQSILQQLAEKQRNRMNSHDDTCEESENDYNNCRIVELNGILIGCTLWFNRYCSFCALLILIFWLFLQYHNPL